MLWIALHPPALSLQALAATLGTAQHALPLALLDVQRIQAVNRVALQLGIKPGFKRATALALAPQLRLGQADAARDAQALRALAHAALAFTPSVTLDGGSAKDAAPPSVLLEVQASLRYFGGLQPLQQRLRAALLPLGLRVRMASAPTALGAVLLARWRAGFELGAHSRDLQALRRQLDAAPLTLLASARTQADTLLGMGLHTLGELRRLPRDGLARRCGEGLLDELDRARGDSADPRDWLSLEPDFEARLELHERADSTGPLLHGAAVLLARLVAWAAAQQARIGGFVLVMQHERSRGRVLPDPPLAGHRQSCGGPALAGASQHHHAEARLAEQTELPVALAEASNDAAHLHALLRERLAQLSLPAPTLELRLRCQQLQRRAAPNSELFPTPASAQEGLLRLIERLQARLGPERVCKAVLLEDHRPERATAWQPALQAAPRRTAAATATPQVPTRPVWLLPQAQALPERQSRALLDGRPLQLLAGPERIEAGWWDGEPAARDYFIAQAHDGALVWIYRTRLPLAQPAGEGWFLQGRFG
jgi:protein ImuB